jgi:predicted CxxxxCH...CXXCH cytochrome family protein
MTHRTIESTFTHEPDRGNHAMSRSRIHQGLAVAALALALAGCGGAAPATATARGKGGASKAEAAQATCTGSGAHDKHQSLGFGCTVCHPGDGGTYGFETYVYPGGTSTAGGVLLLGSATGPTTCTVACHAPLGSPVHPVAWNMPAPLDCTACHTTSALVPDHPQVANDATRDVCLACHDQSQHTSGTLKLKAHPTEWMVQANAGFHAFSADLGLASCQGCHGRDLAGGVSGVGCATCHDRTQPDGTVLAWAKDCTMCHGGTDSPTGAPPRSTWGQSADLVRIGAHTKHAGGSALAPAFDCELCHVKPADAFAAGHIDGATATVAFAGLSVKVGGTAPAWNRASATCSNTYCHGTATPVWTGGATQGVCGTCHGLPPTTSQHPVVSSDLTGCAICHAKTMDAAGHVIPPGQGGMHLDGVVQSTGHDPSWMDQASTSFHAYAADRGLGPCQACHGTALDGGIAQVACGSCHDKMQPDGTVLAWSRNCLMCHGGVDNQTGAPPRATWGNASDPIRVGAHTVHLAGSAIAGPVACGSCHAAMTDAFSPGHIVNGIAHLTFGGLATAGNAHPSWNRSTATCSSTYCHGGYSGTYSYTTWDYALDRPITVTMTYGGGNGAPLWTDGPMTCTSCHGNPPRQNGNWHAGSHGGGNDCQICHPDAVGSSGVGTAITNPAQHVNGVVEVAPQWKTTCFYCH